MPAAFRSVQPFAWVPIPCQQQQCGQDGSGDTAICILAGQVLPKGSRSQFAECLARTLFLKEDFGGAESVNLGHSSNAMIVVRDAAVPRSYLMRRR